MSTEVDVNPYEEGTAEEFFNGPVKPNIPYWKQLPYWTAEEATALSFGMEPHTVNSTSLKGKDQDNEFVKTYQQRLTSISRAMEAGELKVKGHQIKPSDFIAFAKKKNFRFPPDLETAFTARGAATPGLNDDLKPKARQSLLKMILGMAMDKYRYQPNQNYQHAAKAIETALENQGLKVTHDTILKWLKTAEDEVGPEKAD